MSGTNAEITEYYAKHAWEYEIGKNFPTGAEFT